MQPNGAPTWTKPGDFRKILLQASKCETGQTRRTPTAVSLAEYLLLFFYNLFSNKTLAATFIKTAKGHPPIRAALRGHVSLAVPLQSGSGVLHLGEVFSQILKCVCAQFMYTHTRMLSAGRS